ncbi:MAG: zinc-dependent metalloprotease [Flavobacteriaceae bacterium]|nr:zinc-dependent metalloprotease [Flavobacteriaceae bacterium]
MKYTLLCLVVLFNISLLSAQFIEEKKDLKSYNGYFNFHYSPTEGKIYLEVDQLNKEFLYTHFLASGIGSNDIGLDRGQIGDGVVVKFIKSGNTILLLQPNQKFRAISDNEFEKKSIEEAFATSIIFGFPIKETKNEKHLIDLTPFLLRDAHHVAKRLKNNNQGTYKLDKSRNVLWLENTKAFPKNVEFESLLTFVGDPKGRQIVTVAPDANSITIRQHIGFIELPDDNYSPRIFDARSGSFPMSYMDYSTPVWEPIKKQFVYRHRLHKKNPNLKHSEAVEPIVYYLDPGTPEPIRSALLEGASWWNQAFDAIGYKDAFQVKMLPPDADPLDVRYNVIQWVHRSTRGWSYGGSINDPRTGEIIKGHVSLGSLRIRQDFLIAQALMNRPFENDDQNYQPMLELALARIRQLSAHEVGHTLGFAHNFAASTNSRASVMDYPHPKITLKKDEIDFSEAYATGIGEWDKVTVAYSYSDVPDNQSEKSYLSKLLMEAFSDGLHYISDADARPQGGAHAKAHLWDNGTSATEELKNVLAVRKKAIENFSIDNIKSGEPLSKLEDVFVPLYFYHRYQTEAAIKSIGGLDYNYAVKGASGIVVQIISKEEQEAALNEIMHTLEFKTLKIPQRILELFPPRALGYERTRESFKSNTNVAFNSLGPVATASNMTLRLLLNAERANRLVEQHALSKSNLSLNEVLSQLIKHTFTVKTKTSYETEIAHTVQYSVFQNVLNLIATDHASPQVKSIANETLDTLLTMLKSNKSTFNNQLIRELISFRKYPERFKIYEVPKIPDGSPIGSAPCLMN